MFRRSQSADSSLIFDPEIESTLRRIRRERRVQQVEPIPMAENRPFGEMGIPSATHSTTSCITKPAITAENFELRPHLIQMIERSQYSGSPTESPTDHISDFVEKCDTIVIKGATDEAIRLRLFPFSLSGKAKAWFKSEPANKYTTWDGLATGFLTKWFPPSKTSRLRTEIQTFRQNGFETYAEAWERFKDLQRQCPHHQIPDWLLVQSFFTGIHDEHKNSINSACNGDMNSKTAPQLLELFDKMAHNSSSWGGDRRGSSSSGTEGATIKALTEQVALLTELMKQNSVKLANVEQVCELCCVKGHSSATCPQVFSAEEVSFVKGAPFYNNTSNPNPRANLSYGNQNYLKPPPPGFPQAFQPKPPYHPQQMPQQAQAAPPQKSSLESVLEQFMTSQIQHNQRMEAQIAQLAQQLEKRPPGHFPSQSESNSEQPKQVNAVITRSGKVLKEPISGEVTPTEDKVKSPGVVLDESSTEMKGTDAPRVQQVDPPRVYVPPAPFPQRLAKAQLEKRYGKFLEMLKDVKVDFSFLDMLAEIPTFAKFLKSLVGNKSKVEEVVKLSHQCSAVIKNDLPPKLGDPGSFSIPVSVGNLSFDRALCDLGASVSIMPLSVFKKLRNVSDLSPTRMTIQLADRSVRVPVGVLLDVPMFVGKLAFPCDFVVMEIPEDSTTPLILGRPCLATAGALIDVKRGKLSLEVGKEKVEFELNKAHETPATPDLCYSINVIEDPGDEITTFTHNAKGYKDKVEQRLEKSSTEREFKVGDKVKVRKHRCKLIPGKRKHKWVGPSTVTRVLPGGLLELKDKQSTLAVKAQWARHYIADVHSEPGSKEVLLLATPPGPSGY